MTDAELRQWLRKPSDWIVLIEQDYMYQVGVGDAAVPTKGTLYFSSKKYIDRAVPRAYVDCIKSIPQFVRSLDRTTLRGQYQLTGGSIEYNNTNGRVAYLLDLPIDGQDARVLIAPADGSFDPVHLFTVSAVRAYSDAPGDILSVEIRDASLFLDQTLGGTVTVGGTGAAANDFRALNFGWVHQVSPKLVESLPNFKYAHSDTGVNTAAVAVRQNGITLTLTTDWSDGADGNFTLVGDPQGAEITCDVLATRSGGSGIGYRLSDAMDFFVGERLGLTAMGKYVGPQYASLVGGLNDYPVGKSIAEATSSIDVINDLMNTRNGFWAFDRQNRLFYSVMRPEALSDVIALSAGAITIASTLTKDDVVAASAKFDHAANSFAAYQGVANRNWSSQTTFSNSLTADERLQYTRDGFRPEAFIGEEPGATAYLGSVVPYQGGAPELYHATMKGTEVVDTLISGATDDAVPDTTPPANVWSMTSYVAAFNSVRRSQKLPWTEFFDGLFGLDNFALELGHIVNFDYPGYGFDGGVLWQVCSVGIVLDLENNETGVNLGLVRRRYASFSGPPPNFELREDDGYELREDDGIEERE